MAVIGELLFYNRDSVSLDAVLRHNLGLIASKVDSLPDAVFDAKTDADLAADLSASEAIAPLSIDVTAAQPSVQEIQVAVSDEFYAETRTVPGMRVTKAIPFEGDANLWHYPPSQFEMNLPRGEIFDRTVVVGMEMPDAQAQQAKSYIDGYVASINRHVSWQKPQIDTYNASIAAAAARAITARRQRRSKAADILRDL